MDPLYLRKLRIERQLNGQQINNPSQNKSKEDVARSAQAQNEQNIQSPEEHQEVSQQPTLRSQSERLMKDLRDDMLSPRQFKMNYLASMERSNYIKKVMNLPDTLPELLIQLQKPELAKDIKNVLMQPIPEPDTKNPQEEPVQEQNKGNNPQNKGSEQPTQKPNVPQGAEEFEKVLQTEITKSNIIKGQVEHTELTQNKPASTVNQQPKGEQTNNQSGVQPQQTVINKQISNVVNSDNIQQKETSQNKVPNQERPHMDNIPQTREQAPEKSNQKQGALNDKIIPNNRIPSPQNGGRGRNPIHINPADNKIPNMPPKNIPADNIGMNINNLNKPEIIMNKNILQMQYDNRFNHRIPRNHDHGERPELPPPKPLNKETEAMANLYANLAINDAQNPTLTQMRQRLSDDAIELLFTGLINLKDLSNTMKENGHDARSKLIIAMAAATKQGIDSSQISGTMKMISEQLATEENNPASILKNIIMLYLPWYPLQEGVGFNLSIETMNGDSDFSSLLKVFIQTRNYGNVNGSLVLLSGNNVDMNIQCNDTFPQDDLLDRMKDVTQNHSIQSNITVEERAQMANEAENQQAKVNMSSTYELNPFLLLMAHSFIKNTIIIDSGANA